MSSNPNNEQGESNAGAESHPAAPTTQTASEEPRPAVTENDSGRPTFDKNAYRRAPAPAPGRGSTPRATQTPSARPRPAAAGNDAGPSTFDKNAYRKIPAPAPGHGSSSAAQSMGQSWKGHKKANHFDRNHIQQIPPPPGAIDLAHEGTPSLASLKPFPPKELRHRIWCRNCYRMHDPSLCLGPVIKGVIDICPICGCRHLAEECPYYTKDRMIEYCWVNRQCRPPIQTRADFSRVVLTPEQKRQIVAPVQTVAFSRRRDEEEWRRAISKSLGLPWKTHDYRQEAHPRQEAESAKRYYEGGRVPRTPLRYDPAGKVDGGPPPTKNPKEGTTGFNVETDVSYRVALLEKERQLIETRARAEAEARARAEAEAAAADAAEAEAEVETKAGGAVVEDQAMSSTDPKSAAREDQSEAVINHIFPLLEAASQSLLDPALAKIAENPLFASEVIKGITVLQGDIRAAAGRTQPASEVNPIFAQLEAASQSLLDLVAANAAEISRLASEVAQGVTALQNEIRTAVVEAKANETQKRTSGFSEIEAGKAEKEQAVASLGGDSDELSSVLDALREIGKEEKPPGKADGGGEGQMG
ncbi:hypothetical protein DL769_000630 [Monosporascus sp. CRB-8-3]|nr:hypothetical protein DL769_000630 [Monosporascus sp. CRB-8-3]